MDKNYDDIINLPHHTSKRHVRMSPAARAAQFSPFAALTGHDAAIRETARRTDRRIDLSEDERAALDEKLATVVRHLEEMPCVTVTYFVPDEKKAGGAYVTVTGRIRKLDGHSRTLVMADRTGISVDDISELEGEIFDLV